MKTSDKVELNFYLYIPGGDFKSKQVESLQNRNNTSTMFLFSQTIQNSFETSRNHNSLPVTNFKLFPFQKKDSNNSIISLVFFADCLTSPLFPYNNFTER